MSDLHILRQHTLGLEKARKITDDWIVSAEKDYRMTCLLERNDDQDIVQFKRSGVEGVFISTADKFEMNAKLGFLFKSFLPKIKEQIEKNLDGVVKG